MRRHTLAGVENIRNIRLPVFVQRSRHANNDRLHFLDPAEIRGCAKPSGFYKASNTSRSDVFDVTPALINGRNLGRINVQSQNGGVGPRKLQRQGQPDVSQTYDRNVDVRFHFLTRHHGNRMNIGV